MVRGRCGPDGEFLPHPDLHPNPPQRETSQSTMAGHQALSDPRTERLCLGPSTSAGADIHHCPDHHDPSSNIQQDICIYSGQEEKLAGETHCPLHPCPPHTRIYLQVSPLSSLLNLEVFYYRQHIVQWRRIHPQLYGWKPAPSLNTQATVYNRTNLRRIVSYLRRSPDSGPLDLQISKYRKDANFAGFLLEPNLVRHIGSQSSRYQVRTGDTREFQVNYSI